MAKKTNPKKKGGDSMQTAIGTTNGRPGTTYYQRGRMHRHQPGNRQQKEKKAAAGRTVMIF